MRVIYFCSKFKQSGSEAKPRFIELPLCLLAIIFTAILAGGQISPARLSLEEAIEKAVNNNNSLANSRLEEIKTENQIKDAKSFRYPQLNIEVGGFYPLIPLKVRFRAGEFGHFPGIGNVPASEVKISQPRSFTAVFGVQAQQPISQLYRINLGIRQLKLKNEISKEATKMRRLAVIDDVKQAFYGIWRNQAAIAALEEAEKTLGELDRVTENFVRYEVALKSDSLEVKTQLMKTQNELNTLRNSLATQKEQLNFLMNRPISTEFELAEVAPPTLCEIDLGEARKRALAQRPEIRQSELATEVADLQVKVKKAEKIPEIGVGISYLSPQNFNAIVPKNFASVAVSFKWEVFDYGRKSRAVEDARLDTQRARNTSEDVKNQILIEVGDRFRKLQQSRDTLKTAQMAQEAAREKFRVVVKRYENGEVLVADTLRAEADVADANNQFQQSILAFLSAKAAFEKALGEEK